MGLETTTYLSGLTETWPLAGDLKSQGDDHIRLIKATLKSTFPTASKAFYFPTAETSTTAMVLDATDMNNLVLIDATSGDIAVTLPAGLTANDKGFFVEVAKTAGAATNGVVVSPSSGTISSAVGATATIRIERLYEPVKFRWTGSLWFAVKPGAPIGSSMNWDQATVPAGYRTADGTVYSTTTFAEYNAVKGNATVPDKRGRVEAGVDNGAVNRLTATYFGTASILGATGGVESHTLSTAQMPAHDHGGVTGAMSANATHSHQYNFPAPTFLASGGGPTQAGGSTPTATDTVNLNHTHSITSQGSGLAHNNTQPTIITQKLIRVC